MLYNNCPRLYTPKLGSDEASAGNRVFPNIFFSNCKFTFGVNIISELILLLFCATIMVFGVASVEPDFLYAPSIVIVPVVLIPGSFLVTIVFSEIFRNLQ